MTTMATSQWTPSPRLPDGAKAVTCLIADCDDGDIQAHGWCHKHYIHWFTYGDPVLTPIKAPRTTIMTNDLLRMLDGRATYRQIDYWIRTGTIQIADRPRGSGEHRQFTSAESAAISTFVDLLHETNVTLEQLRSGAIYADLLAKFSKEAT